MLRCAESTGILDQDAVLSCSLHSEYDDVTVTKLIWQKVASNRTSLIAYKDGIFTTQNQRFSLQEDWSNTSRDVSLVVRKTQTSDQGHYRCIAVSNRGIEASEVTLIVTARVTADEQAPKEQEKPRYHWILIAALVGLLLVVGGFLLGRKFIIQRKLQWQEPISVEIGRKANMFSLTMSHKY
ncbi:UNVERIFIED_CONTAM: hypothetical protein FKN15_015212 [Acipenser sinensis]